MKRPAGTWLIYPLAIEGSYQKNLERPAEKAGDTMQYWITSAEAVDVRSFFIDKDLRILSLDLSNFKEDPVEYLDGVAHKTYGDILRGSYRVDLPLGTSDEDLIAKVSASGLFPNAHWTALDFPLWLPEYAEYASRGDD